MTALKASEVARFVRRPDRRSGVFLFYGPDFGLVHEMAQALIGGLAVGGQVDVVLIEANETETVASRLAVEARSRSLFGGQRILRLRSADRTLVPVLRDLLAEPDLPAIVIEGGNLAGKDGLRALIEAAPAGRALPCYADTSRTIEELIRESLSGAGISIEPDALAALRDCLGNDREVTRRELEKLSLFARESRTLTLPDVLALSADNGAVMIDSVLDATGTGHPERLETALSRALTGGIDPQRILTAAGQHFGTLRQLRAEIDAGKPARAALDAMRPRPHFSRVAFFEQQLRLWNDEALAAAESRLIGTVADSRKRPALAEAGLRRVLLALCMTAMAH